MARAVVVGAGVSGLCTAALLAREGVGVEVLERSGAVGGRTASSRYRGHVLDNGFHIMPFYRASALYGVLRSLGLAGAVGLARVGRIAFYLGGRFHAYPRGIGGLLRLSTVPLRSRLALLRVLLPMAFSTHARAEAADGRPLTDATAGLDPAARSFFDAVCMLAFADSPGRVSLGEFTRTMMRANPFRGGTSEFAYPAAGGYDTIARALASYVEGAGGRVRLSAPAARVVVEGGRAAGVRTASGEFVGADCVVVSAPAYAAAGSLFAPGDLDPGFLGRVGRLERSTSVVEAHYCLSESVDDRQVVFPVGDGHAAKGVFLVSNMSPGVSPEGEHLVMAGTPVPRGVAASRGGAAEVAARMRDDISRIYPRFGRALLWERSSAWATVESVAKGPGMVWRDKAPHQDGRTAGLFFVGDSTVSYGIGTDSAAHSSVLCHPKIMGHLRGRGR